MLNPRTSLILAAGVSALAVASSCGSAKNDAVGDSAADVRVIDSPVDVKVSDSADEMRVTDSADEVTVTFDLTDIDPAYVGKFIYLGLLAGTASCTSDMGADAHVAGAIVTTETCEISLPAVAKGTYTACAFLDVDGSGQPSTGDLAGQLSLVLTADDSRTWSVRDWMTISSAPPPTIPDNVGYQELTFTDTSRGRTLRTAFWYPAAAGAPDASGGPYPLILFSHGDHGSSTNGQYDFLKNAWASKGFVVVGPDHQKNTWYDADDSDANRAAIQFDRPLDIRFVTDQVLLLNQDATSFLHGMINPDAIGMSGVSFGGHTTLMVAGATPNLDHLAEYCQSNPGCDWDVCCLQDEIQQLYPGQRIIDLSDPRMKAALSLAGDGYGWFLQDGMAKIKMPIMFMVGRLDTLCPLDTQAMPEYEGVVSTKYLFIQDKADHSVFGNGCSQQTYGDCDTLHEQIEFVSTAFWMLHLKNDASYAEKLRSYAQPGTTLLSEAPR